MVFGTKQIKCAKADRGCKVINQSGTNIDSDNIAATAYNKIQITDSIDSAELLFMLILLIFLIFLNGRFSVLPKSEKRAENPF